MPPDDELGLLFAAARAGDRLALAAAIRNTQADVQRLAARLVAPEEAEDVAQEVFVRAWRALPAFRGDASGRTWLFAIARRTCADRVRARDRGRRLGARLREVAARTHRLDHPSAVLDIEDAIDRLARERREAFLLTQVFGFSYAETAQACGTAVGTVRSRVARARAELADAIRRSEIDAPVPD